MIIYQWKFIDYLQKQKLKLFKIKIDKVICVNVLFGWLVGEYCL